MVFSLSVALKRATVELERTLEQRRPRRSHEAERRARCKRREQVGSHMSLLRWLALAVSLVVVALAVGLLAVSWEDRADDVCREKAPSTGSSYTLAWKWDEFAYVCDYQSPSEPPRRVGVIDAFHSGGRQRHRP